VLTSPLSEYLRYECEWGYLPNAAAGEDIRILDLAEKPRPDGLISEDFWLMDNEAPAAPSSKRLTPPRAQADSPAAIPAPSGATPSEVTHSTPFNTSHLVAFWPLPVR
jgi:hypothetical protein